jgi:hypothetical protein
MRRRQILAALAPIALGGCIRLEGTDGTARTRSTPADRTATASETVATEVTTNDREPTTDTTTDAEPTTETDTATEADETSDGTGPTLLSIDVDWSALEDSVVEPTRTSGTLAFGAAPTPASLQAGSITALGVRLLDGNGQLVSARSVERTGETDTLQLLADATRDGVLQLAAVDAASDRTETIALAERNGLEVAANQTTTVDATTARWLRARWYVLDDYADTYENGTFTADKDANTFDIQFAATYPFSGQNISYRDLLVQLQGRGGPIQNTGDHHTYRIIASNPDPGTTNTTTHTFQPDLASDKFALPPGRYPIGSQGKFSVDWV